MEPHAGVEPASSAWQADIIAIIRMRHMKFLNGATCRSRTGVLCMASRYNSHYTNAAYEVLKLEPHAGVEPASSAWQADIIAIIRMRPH